jgi:hypothetical protein
MKFFVPNYSCLQKPWLGGYRPQIPVLSVLNWLCWTPLRTKFLGTPLLCTGVQLNFAVTFRFLLKSGKSDEHLPRRPAYVSARINLRRIYGSEKCFVQNLKRKVKHILRSLHLFCWRDMQVRPVYRPLARQLTRVVPTDAGFECAEAAMLGDTIKGTVCTDRRERIIPVTVYNNNNIY